MPAVKYSLGHKNFTFRVAGVGLVSLIQDHNGISHMEVLLKVHPEVGLDGSPPPPPLRNHPTGNRVRVSTAGKENRYIWDSSGVGEGGMKSSLTP